MRTRLISIESQPKKIVVVDVVVVSIVVVAVVVIVVVVVVHPRNLTLKFVEIRSVTAVILLTLSLCGWWWVVVVGGGGLKSFSWHTQLLS